MRVPHILGSCLHEGQRVEHRLDGRAPDGLGIDTGCVQRIPDGLIAEGGLAGKRGHRRQVHTHEAALVDGTQFRAAGFDPERAVVAQARGVPLTEDDQVATRVAQPAGHGDDGLQDRFRVSHDQASGYPEPPPRAAAARSAVTISR